MIMMYTDRLTLHSLLVKRVVVLERCGKEEDGGNFDETKTFQNSKPFQFRVGYDHGPQVPDPRLGQVF